MRTNLVRRSCAIAIAVAALVPAAALGVGFSAPNVNPADLAMMESRVAAQDSAAAVFANPSALARLPGLNVSAAGSAIDFGSKWTDPTRTQSTASTNSNFATPPALYASYGFALPNGMAAAVGAGLSIPFGGNLYWPENWPGRFDIVNVDRRMYGTYLTAALEPLPWFRIGGGLVWYHGTEHLSQALNFGSSEGTTQLSTVGDARSFDVSAEIQPFERLRVGVDYKHQAPMTLDGHVHFANAPPQFGLVDQSVQHQATMPNTLDVGLSYRVLPALLVTGAFSWERYVVFARDTFVGSSGLSIVVPRNYHNGHTYRLGVEGGPVGRFKVRLGAGRGIAPTPADWLHASIPDANVWLASGGLAYAALPSLEVSAAYQRAFFDQTRTCQATGGACAPDNVFPGIQDAHANVFSLGVTWRWAGGR
jgi:long-chain fatty acid transport protein